MYRPRRWTGPAGQAVKTVVRAQPGRYQSAGEAFLGAAGAVRVFADALEDAQHVVAAAAQLGGGDLGASLVSAARDDLGTAAQRTAAVLYDLARGAPRSESLLGRLTADGFDAVALPAHVAKGVAVGAASMADGLSRLGTVQALESPAVALVDRGVWKRVGSQIDVAREAVHDPAGFMESAGKSLVAWDEWSKDPAQALGQVLMMAAGTAFTDGAGDAADGAAAAADVADAATRGGSDLLRVPTANAWANADSLAEHFEVHGAALGAVDADDYAEMASGFFQHAIKGGVQIKIDEEGIIRIYDPDARIFGAYNPNGTARTFMKITRPGYWTRQHGNPPWPG